MRTLILDGDLIAFTVAARVETNIDWGEDTETRDADPKRAEDEVVNWIEEMQAKLWADAVIVAVGDPSRRYFRHDIYPDYKLDRTHGTPPILLKHLKKFLEDADPAVVGFTPKMKPGLEADDVMGILASHPSLVPGEKIIVTADKDLKQIAGLHFNPKARDAEIFEITPAQGDDWFLMQSLTGDTTDGFPGCPGIGPVKARKLLGENPTVAESWPKIVAAYAAKNRDEQYALTQARCARILRHDDWDYTHKRAILWTPQSSS